MLKYVVSVVIAFASLAANAQVYKCQGANGKLQFSDKPCLGAAQSELVPDKTSRVTPQQQYEAQQRTARMQSELTAQDDERSAAKAGRSAEQQREEEIAARNAARNRTAANDADAVNECIKDVERRGGLPDVKTRMIGACRTAGTSQRTQGSSADAVKACVAAVERSAASENEKTRQIAVCHGGDVPPEILPPPSRRQRQY